MYEKGFDPHYLIDNHMIFLFKMVGINRNTAIIDQVYIKVVGPDGELIYGN
jgi:hypothetical protein